MIRRSGAKRAHSLAQFATTLVGATTRNGAIARPSAGRLEPSGLDHRDRLQGLAEAHIVGEDPAQAVRAQEVQP